MIHDPQYLIGADIDREHKAYQLKNAEGIFKDNKEVRKQIKIKKSVIKDNYLTVTQSSTLGIKKSDMQKWIDEGKLQGIVYDGRLYYSREDIANCM